MAKYIIQGETLKAIADEVRELTDITDEINPNEMIANIEQANADVAAQMEIIEQIRTALNGKAGSNAAEIGVIIDQSGVLDSTEGTVEEKVEQLVDKAQWEQVWYEASERLTTVNKCFENFQGVKAPRTNFVSATMAENVFTNALIEYVDYYIDTKVCTRLVYFFRFCTHLKNIVGINTQKAQRISGLFFCCYALETIEKPLNFSNAVNGQATNVFDNCNALKNICFDPESIKLSISIPSAVLSDESIQSIIDGLATVETAQTLTLHADVKAKLTQTQLDTITGKNWNLA